MSKRERNRIEIARINRESVLKSALALGAGGINRLLGFLMEKGQEEVLQAR